MQNPSQVISKETAEKTARSIFVGNIPYEATEEKLIELFAKAGPVVGFRLVYDRESGKPKGYGFCEYRNAAIASSALRNLQTIEFNGRPLRIGPAAGEQNSAEIALSNPTVGPPQESQYGESVEPSSAPEAITRAVASLPPEQMYELMKQMKLCIQNNPNEARNMLLQNPQLAYALLQAQIVMKIVDPKVAIAMLNRSHDQIPPLQPDPHTISSEPRPYKGPNLQQEPLQRIPIDESNKTQDSDFRINPPRPMGRPADFPPSNPFGPTNIDLPRPKSMQPVPSAGPQISPGSYPPHHREPQFPGNRPPMYPPQQRVPSSPAPQRVASQPPSLRPRQITPQVAAAAAAHMGPDSFLAGQGEQEKVALIMQVLQLSDEHIAMLPEDQQRSILILKEQLGKTGAI